MDAAALQQLWTQTAPAVEELARFSPRGLDSSVWTQVAAGKIARPKVERGAMGVGLLACDRAAAWLAITDDHPVQEVDGLTQIALSGAWAGEKYLYQLLDLPWPFADRHWVLHGTTNLALAAASGVWERAWESAPDWLPKARDRVGADRFDAALPVPVNRGSWLLVDAGEGATLAVYRAEADLGGGVPEGAAEAYTSATLDGYYRATLRDAASMATRYGAGCTPQPGGDGAPLPCFAAPPK